MPHICTGCAFWLAFTLSLIHLINTYSFVEMHMEALLPLLGFLQVPRPIEVPLLCPSPPSIDSHMPLTISLCSFHGTCRLNVEKRIFTTES